MLFRSWCSIDDFGMFEIDMNGKIAEGINQNTRKFTQLVYKLDATVK